MLSEGRRLTVFKNRLLRKVHRLKMVKVTGGCRKLHDKKLRHFYSPDISRMMKSKRMKWAGHVECTDDKHTQGFGEQTWTIKTTLKTHILDNIKPDLQEIVWDGVDWINLDQGRDK
jgi:hypothetical protein